MVGSGKITERSLTVCKLFCGKVVLIKLISFIG
jgi:hypothetical protein